MDENFISYDEDEQAAFASGFAKIAADLENLCASSSSSFSSAADVGLLGDVVGKISNQMSGISSSSGTIGNSAKKNASEMFTLDATTADTAETSIIPPKDFLAENTMEVNQYNNSLLGKIDGRSVNEGEQAEKPEEIDDSVVEAENLASILGEQSKEEQYDDSSNVQNSLLGNINKNEATEEQEYNDKVSVSKTNLQNIVGEGTEMQELDGESSIHGESVLGNINKNAETQMQNYVDNVPIAAAQQLGSVESDKLDKDELDKLAMAAAFDNFVANEYSEEDKKEKLKDELEHIDYNEFENTNNV